MAEKRRNLGRGLSALLGDDTATPARAGGAQQIAIGKLHPGRYQPRRTMGEDELKDLSQSIRELGVLQPILVREHPDRAGEYEIIAGERRWRASQLAQLHEVPVLIKALSNQETLEVALVENLQREDLNPIEEAQGFQNLIDIHQYTQEQAAARVGRSRANRGAVSGKPLHDLRISHIANPAKRGSSREADAFGVISQQVEQPRCSLT